MNKKRKILTIVIFTTLLIIQASITTAQTLPSPPNDPDPSGSVTLDDPLGETNPQVLIGRVISAVLGIVGSLALAMFIYGGFIWMTAAGNKERVEKGKNVIVWATIGLVIIFSAYAMVKLVFSGLGIS